MASSISLSSLAEENLTCPHPVYAALDGSSRLLMSPPHDDAAPLLHLRPLACRWYLRRPAAPRRGRNRLPDSSAVGSRTCVSAAALRGRRNRRSTRRSRADDAGVDGRYIEPPYPSTTQNWPARGCSAARRQSHRRLSPCREHERFLAVREQGEPGPELAPLLRAQFGTQAVQLCSDSVSLSSISASRASLCDISSRGALCSEVITSTFRRKAWMKRQTD